FEHGKNMLLTPRNNVQALTSTLLSLYKDAALQQQLRQGALSLANLFSWDHVVADYCAFYQQVVEAYV
ncbi:MAG: glycosyltransferase, partial [Phototrophicaceae bacterium]